MTLTSWVSDTGTTLALDGSAGVSVLRGARGFDGPPIRNTLDPRVGDGATRVNYRRPERPVTLPLKLDLNLTDAATVVRLFQSGYFVASSGRTLTGVVYEDGLEGQWTVDTGGVVGLNHRKFTVSLCALDPWWYGEETSVTGTFGTSTAWSAAVAWNAALPWDGGSSQTIVNAGDVATWATVVVKGATTTATMSINGMGGWTTTNALASSAYMAVSTEPDRRGPHLGPHGHFAGSDGPILWSLLTEGSQLFELPAGSSSLVFGATGTDGNTAWTVFYSPRYYTS
jgi:hypothetical protein